MERVRGIGGIFFKAKDPAGLGRWYRDHLGFPLEPWGGAQFRWRDHDSDGEALTVWSPFPETTTHFAPSTASFMLNLRVDDLDAMLAQLRAAGAVVEDKVTDDETGRFGYAMDPEGNRLELWQPKK